MSRRLSGSARPTPAARKRQAPDDDEDAENESQQTSKSGGPKSQKTTVWPRTVRMTTESGVISQVKLINFKNHGHLVQVRARPILRQRRSRKRCRCGFRRRPQRRPPRPTGARAPRQHPHGSQRLGQVGHLGCDLRRPRRRPEAALGRRRGQPGGAGADQGWEDLGARRAGDTEPQRRPLRGPRPGKHGHRAVRQCAPAACPAPCTHAAADWTRVNRNTQSSRTTTRSRPRSRSTA